MRVTTKPGLWTLVHVVLNFLVWSHLIVKSWPSAHQYKGLQVDMATVQRVGGGGGGGGGGG